MTRLLSFIVIGFSIVTIPSHGQAPDVRQGLVAYWPLDALSEDQLTAPDQSSFGNHLNAVNIDSSNVAAGRHGNAVTFNGTDELLSRIHDGTTGLPIQPRRRFTVALWVKGLGSAQQDRRVFAEGSTTSQAPLFNIGTDSAASGRVNVVDIFVRNDANTAVLNHIKTVGMAFDDTWHHIAWVESNGVGRVYIDGQVDPRVFDYGAQTMTMNAIALGGIQRLAAGSFFAGMIDDAAVWERPLTQSEIQQVMTNSMVVPIPPLPPYIATHPVGGARKFGDAYTLSVYAAGDRPLSYQWYDGTTLIPDATGPSLVFSNLTTGGNFTVVVTNPSGSVTSSVAVVTVTPDGPPALQNGIVSYWPFNLENFEEPEPGRTTVRDLYSRNDMQFTNMDISNFSIGHASDALLFNGTDEYTFRVGGSPIYNNLAYSVSLWINGAGTGQSDRRFFSEGATNSNTPLFCFGTHPTGANGSIRVFIRNDANATVVALTSVKQPLDSTWHHVVWTDNNGQGRLYIDGQMDTTDFFYTRAPLTAHHTSVGAILRAAAGSWFAGAVDEVAVWNRAISYTEIQDLYANGVPEPVSEIAPSITRELADQEVWAGEPLSLSVDASGTNPLHPQWRRHGTNIPNATNLSYSLPNPQATDSGPYAIVITNNAGSVTSRVATITIKAVTGLTTALIAHWPLDDISAMGRDVSSNGYHLNPINLGPENQVPGQYDNAVTLNGTDEFLARMNASGPGLPVAGNRSFTIAMWVNGTGVGQSDRRIFSEGSIADNDPLFTLGTANDGASSLADVFIRSTDAVTTLNHAKSTLNVFDGVWHHLAWTDLNGSGRFYVDGILDTNINYPRVSIAADTISLGGIQRAVAGFWFAGSIDDAAVWSRALTEAEINSVMGGGIPPSVVRVQRIEVNAGTITLTISTPSPGATHDVQQSTDLVTWTDVQNVSFGAPSGNSFTASFPAPAGTRFYVAR